MYEYLYVHPFVCSELVTAKDMERVGRRLMQTNPSLAAMGDLTHVPERKDVEEALFNNQGSLSSRRRLFSFR